MAVLWSQDSNGTSVSRDVAQPHLGSPPIEGSATFRDGVTSVVPALRAFSRFLCRDRDASDDLVENTIHAVFATQHLLEPGASLKGWLFRVMHNRFYADLRAQDGQSHAPKMGARDTLEPSRRAEENSTPSALSTALWNLDSRDREALVLVGAGGFSCDDAACICGCSTSTMGARVSRAHDQLAEALDRPRAGQRRDHASTAA